MPRRAPSTQLDQRELFRPAPIRSTWAALPSEVQKAAIRLLVEMLRDHWRRNRPTDEAKRGDL